MKNKKSSGTVRKVAPVRKCPSNPCRYRNRYGECNAPLEERIKRYCPVEQPRTAEELIAEYMAKYPKNLGDLAYVRYNAE